MSALSTLAARVDRDAVRAFLAGDLLAVLAFVVLGGFRHGTLSDPARFIGTAVPFLLGWLVVAPLAGAYGPRVRATRGRLLAVTVVAWVAAAAVAQVLRATEPFPGNADAVFFLVTVAFGGGLLVAWRLLRTRVAPVEDERTGTGAD